MAAESHKQLKWIVFVACVAVVTILWFLYVKPGPVKHIDPVTAAAWSHGVDGAAGITSNTTYTWNTTTNKATSNTATNTTSNATTDTTPGSYPNYGYLLSVNIEQQSSGALSGYGDLASMAGYLNLSAVEPYVVGNNFRGVPTIKEKGKARTLSTFFDFKKLQNTVGSCFNKKKSVLEMSSFEQFLTKTSSTVIYAYILHDLGRYKSKFSGGKSKIVEIDRNDKSANDGLTRLNNWAAYVSKEHNMCSFTFRISQVFVIDARPKVALQLTTIQDILGSAIRKQFSMDGSVTVLFDHWRGIDTKPDTGYFYYVPHFHKPCVRLNNIGHSQTVIKASQAFSRHLKDSETAPRICVHIRGERVLLTWGGKFLTCIKEIGDTVTMLVKNSTTTPQVRVIHDFSKYGTRSCWGDCGKYRSKFLSELKKLNLTSVYYDPVDYPSFPRSTTFAAFVEREYLSTCDELVTAGHGGFQMILVKQFMQHSIKHKGHLHRMCILH
ncbi:hypothetical protein GBAR_LOCUS11279 [Geodia barretti]|uniref:Uncharacterized protein n=1 Tax=Geodia barretti TaxID=519541 RepID=A0AA35WLD2_GEOBA|nr:hypothetical protein GBAR_LOCUS11279 [Geodia barretti]